MPSRNARSAALLAACLTLFGTAPARSAEKLELNFSNQEIAAAFEKVLDDPFFERFTGLTVYDKASLTGPERRVGGTQSFRFEKHCVDTTVTETPRSETSYRGVYQVTKTWTERQTRTTSTKETRYLSYMPTLEFPKKAGGKVKLSCDAGEFGKDPGGGKVSPFGVLGGLFGAIGKGFAMGAIGARSWSGGSGCDWTPFNPAEYASWIENKWLPWRIKQFLPGGEDKLEKAFSLFGKKKYEEALPLFLDIAANFGYAKNKVPKNEYAFKVWPFTYSSQLPEVYAILGDIYRLHVKDMEKAEEYYRIAYSVNDSPYLAETAGIARANRGLGYTMAARAQAAKEGPDKDLFEQLGSGAAFHLYAYLGFYKDKDAPDKAAVMKLIEEVDPEEIRHREQAAERKEKMEQGLKENKEQREKVKAIMEY